MLRPPGQPAALEAGPSRAVHARGTSLVWLRRDLRLDDNPALAAALKTGGAVVLVYVWAPGEEGQFEPGTCSRWWLFKSLTALSASVRKLGGRLILRSARKVCFHPLFRAAEQLPGRRKSLEALEELLKETGAHSLFFNNLYDANSLSRDSAVKSRMSELGVVCDSFNADLLYEPTEIYASDGSSFEAFEPFWAKLLGMLYEPYLPSLAPKALPPCPEALESALPEELALITSDESSASEMLGRRWSPGEEAGRSALDDFLAERLRDYEGQSRLSDVQGTSQLSPHLHFGELSVRRVWYQTKQMEWLWAQSAPAGSPGCADGSVAAFQRALCMREYSRYLSFHYPFTAERSLSEALRSFPWRYSASDFKAWRQGTTGYPLVDAGMRQLWATGWIHNRIRRVVASFLVKHLLLPWQWGLKHYWDTLLDADLESAVLGWQFVAGGLPDGEPFATLPDVEEQGRRYDPSGHFVRRWVPQLARVPTEYIHAPSRAPPAVLEAACVELGTGYPMPICSREACLARLEAALLALKASQPARAAEAARAAAASGEPPRGADAQPPPPPPLREKPAPGGEGDSSLGSASTAPPARACDGATGGAGGGTGDRTASDPGSGTLVFAAMTVARGSGADGVPIEVPPPPPPPAQVAELPKQAAPLKRRREMNGAPSAL